MKFKVLTGLFTGLLLILGLMTLGRPAQAIDSTVLESKYKVSFPIAQLGGCADYSSCRAYCEDPVHATACINFAKEKGFYQEEPVAKFVAVLSTAKSVLGCDSLDSCQNFCEIPANFDKCNSFARSTGLAGGYVGDPGKQEILSRAEGRLGCSSADGCKGFCEKVENRAKCEAFAKEVGLVGGTHSVGPGGCTSEDSCRAFCSDPGNFSICRNFAAVTGVGGFKGPGGCDSEDSCKTYCSSRPAECGFNTAGKTNYSPVEMCNRTPNCSWRGNSCSCGNFGETDESRAGTGFSGPTDPAAACARYGCSWTNNTCQCTSGMVTTGTIGAAPPGGTAGCTPPSSANPCVSGQHYSYSSCRCEANTGGDSCSSRWGCPSGMSWNENTCDCRTAAGDWRPPSGYYSNPSTTPSRESQEAACRAGGGTCVSWVNGACGCERGGTMSRESQEATCRSGGGTCDWTSGFCYCRGYQTPSGTTNTNANPANYGSCPSGQYWNGSSCVTSSAPTMTRESQQSACSNCGGTCSWNGDTCACQCTTTSGGSGSQSPEEACRRGTNCTWTGSSCQCTASEPTPSPSPSPSTDPATACGQTSGCSWTGSTCQCGSTQGAATEQSFLQTVWNFLSGLAGR